MQTVCVRHVPEGVRDEARLTAHNLGIVERINRGGRAYLTPSVLKGKQMIRVSIGAEATTREDVAAAWEELRRESRR